ncbi:MULTISPECIES: hypothetical protein [unclassified Aurantimonas]|uniref:hypothetical protein n=1 Tax=unclassified Aurantimonas TaxID=2638230 RepID=UPI002E171375|nr:MULTISPECIES: hypothetical protein [unclassified Aurantimonas]MEC5291566.1 hypothetical protein [Aurantimonas sp. C2-3-R2]MEC5412650.1 hypothetical protein [Aurantimonas sp. C2-4-R8]
MAKGAALVLGPLALIWIELLLQLPDELGAGSAVDRDRGWGDAVLERIDLTGDFPALGFELVFAGWVEIGE